MMTKGKGPSPTGLKMVVSSATDPKNNFFGTKTTSSGSLLWPKAEQEMACQAIKTTIDAIDFTDNIVK
jgi:hypothetical protein